MSPIPSREPTIRFFSTFEHIARDLCETAFAGWILDGRQNQLSVAHGKLHLVTDSETDGFNDCLWKSNGGAIAKRNYGSF